MFFFKSVFNTWPTNCAKMYQVMEWKVCSVSMSLAPLWHSVSGLCTFKIELRVAEKNATEPVNELPGRKNIRRNGVLRFAFSLASVASFLPFPPLLVYCTLYED